MYLNCHSYYSLRYGTMSVEKLVAEAKRNGIPSLALTDINNTMGTIDFIRECRLNNIKPVAGIEFRDDENKFILVNQVDRLITYLLKDRTTSRGILHIPEGKDYHLDEEGEEKKDEPCTMFVQYCHRGSELHCFVRMRSNDLILGAFNVNLFEWTFLQQLVANEISTDVGSYNVNAVSMHIYDNWMAKVPLFQYTQPTYDVYSIIEPHRLTLTWSEFKKHINPLLNLELEMRAKGFVDGIREDINMLPPDLRDMFLCMAVTVSIKKKDPSMMWEVLTRIRNKTYLTACLEYVARRWGNTFEGLIRKVFNQTLGFEYIEHSNSKST